MFTFAPAALRDNGQQGPSPLGIDNSWPAKPSILVFIWYYLPGSKSGGPLNSMTNLVESLGDEFVLRIVTSDRDPGDTVRYPGIEVNRWYNVGKAQVLYIPPGIRGLQPIARMMRETPHDALYLNSFVNPRFTVFPLLARRTGLVPRRPVFSFSTRRIFQRRTGSKARQKASLHQLCAAIWPPFGCLASCNQPARGTGH